MPQEPGNCLAGLVGRGASGDPLLVPLRRTGVPEAVEGHGTRRASVLDVGSGCTNKRLQLLDRCMSLDAIRDKELVSPGCNPQMQLQAARQDGMQRDCPDEAALALDGDNPLPNRSLRRGGVDPEALMDSPARIPGPVADPHVVLPAPPPAPRPAPGRPPPAPPAAPPAMAFGSQIVTAAKLMTKAAKDYEGKIVLKCAFSDNAYVDKKGVEALATMPSREELVAKMLGSMQAPLANFAGVLNNLVSGIVRVLARVAENKA